LKNRSLFYLVLILVILLSTYYFLDSKVNNVKLQSNKESGLYYESLNLIIDCDDSLNNKFDIRYTTDCSEPVYNSPIYLGNLLIHELPNLSNLSFIKTTAPDSITKFPEKWIPPSGNQANATVIKYAAFINDKISSKVYTKTFFKKDSINIIDYQIPVISISTDVRNLFSQNIGLFVSGNKFEIDDKHSGNFFERGKEFERKVFFQYFDKNMNLEFETYLGMRIHGGVSRRFPQKSLKFYKRKEYNSTKINLPYLSEKRVKRFILEGMQESGGGRALIEDIVGQNIIRDLNFEQQSSNPVIVFINGEYWGLYTLRDRLDEHYLSYKFNLHRDSFLIVDGHARRNFQAIHGDNSEFIDLLNFIDNNDLSVSENYSYVVNKIDLDNFIDYFSVQIFFANLDWPVHNIKFWKKRKNGKWRIFMYDIDGGFRHKSPRDTEEDYLKDMFTYLLNNNDCKLCKNPPRATLLFRSLSKNIHFRNQFESRYKYIIDNFMDTKKTLAIVDSISLVYDPYIAEHINRWGFPKSKQYWEDQIDSHLNHFLINREKATLENLHNYLMKYDN